MRKTKLLIFLILIIALAEVSQCTIKKLASKKDCDSSDNKKKAVSYKKYFDSDSSSSGHKKNTKPVKPVAPTKPTTPTTPTKPTTPTTPTKPITPTTPTKPTTPTYPTTPTIPTTPTVPTTPTIPTIPTVPITPTYPTIPTVPIVVPGGYVTIPNFETDVGYLQLCAFLRQTVALFSSARVVRVDRQVSNGFNYQIYIQYPYCSTVTLHQIITIHCSATGVFQITGTQYTDLPSYNSVTYQLRNINQTPYIGAIDQLARVRLASLLRGNPRISILKVAEPYYDITYECDGGYSAEARLVYDPFRNNVDILDSRYTESSISAPIIANPVGNSALQYGLTAANVLGANSYLTGNANSDAILGLRLQNTGSYGSLLNNSYASKIAV